MANRYWVGGSGIWNATNTANWSATSGGSGGASVPTQTDMVFFNSSSGGGTVKVEYFDFVSCQNFNASGFTGTFQGYASLYDPTYPNWIFECRINIYPQDGTTSNIVLGTTATYANQTDPTGLEDEGPGLVLYVNDPGERPTATLKSDGVVIRELTIFSFIQLSGLSHSFSLLDNLTVWDLEFWVASSTGFTFNTNNYTINTKYWNSVSAATGTWNFGSSTINIGGVATPTKRPRGEFSFERPGATRPATVNATSCTVNLISTADPDDIFAAEVILEINAQNNTASSPAGHAWGAVNIIDPFGEVEITNSGGSFTSLTITQSNPEANYIACGRNSTTDIPGFSVGTLTVTSYSAGYRLGMGPIAIAPTTLSKQMTLTVTTANLTNVDFYGVIAAGSAAPFTGAGNLGENSNINFPTGVTRYAVSAGGNWGDTSTWSTTSGGASGASSPLPQDVAIFDANSSGTYNVKTLGVQIDASAFSDSAGEIVVIDDTGSLATGDNARNRNLFIRNQLILPERDTLTLPRNYTILTSSSGSFALKTYNENVTNTNYALVNCACTLEADINNSGSFWMQRNSSFDGNGFDVTMISEFSVAEDVSTSRTLDLGGGHWTLGFWDADATNLTFTKDSSNITLKGSFFNGASLTYNDLIVEGTGSLTINGSNTFGQMLFYRPAPYTITFEASSTQTMTNFRLRGTPGNLITLQSSAPPSQFGLALSISKKIGCNFLSLSYSNASPTTDTWYAGGQSVDGGNNSGWIFRTLAAAGMFMMF